MEANLYSVALVIIALTCIGGALVKKFDDNLGQTIGLGIACLGASVRVLEVLGSFVNDTNARYLMTYGIAIFCLGTIYKYWKKP